MRRGGTTTRDGPALVGAEFANGACVLFYQYGGGSYTNFGPIRPAAPAA